METTNKNTPSKVWFRSLNRYELTRVCVKYKFKEGEPLTDEQIETMYNAETKKEPEQIPSMLEELKALRESNKALLEALKGLCDKLEHLSLWDKTDRYYYAAKAAIEKANNTTNP